MEFDFQAFVMWLQSQPEGVLVGVVGDCYAGPLARWLEATTGERWLVSWDADSYRLDRLLNWRPLPLWAGLFYYQIEGRMAEGAGISKELALAVLGEVEAEWSECCHW
jgi:hypothetical protein